MAWLSTALDQEEAHMALCEYLLSMIDIWKCFDQVVPCLAQLLCGLAGMPAGILSAYSRLMAKIKVVNCLALGAGEPYEKACSIPQGCPWSMTILALMTLPWLRMVEQ